MRLCPGSDMVFDCTEDTTELRCAGCGRMKKVTPQLTGGSNWSPAFSIVIHGRIWRARIPQHRR